MIKLKKDGLTARLFYYISLIGSILMAVLVIYSAVVTFTASDEELIEIAEVNVVADEIKYEETNVEGLYVTNELIGALKITEVKGFSGFTAFLFYLWKISGRIVGCAVLFLTSRIFKDVVYKTSFYKKGLKYLYAIGWIILLTPLVLKLFNFYAESVFRSMSFPADIKLTLIQDYGHTFFITGVFILLIAYVLKKEKEMIEGT